MSGCFQDQTDIGLSFFAHRPDITTFKSNKKADKIRFFKMFV